MSQDPKSDRELSPLARSIDDLFRSSEAEPETVDPEESAGPEGAVPADVPAPADTGAGDHDDVAWVAESGVDPDAPPVRASDPSSAHAGHDPLMRTVATYLRADPEARTERVEELRLAFEDAQERNAGRAMLEAVEALVHAGARDDVSSDLARSVLSPSIAGLFAQRLVDAVGEEARRSDLVGVLTALGPKMAIAIGKELDGAEDRSVRRALVETLVQMGEDAQGAISRMVGDHRWYVVRNGVTILGKIGDDASIEHLASTVAHEQPAVRKETISALTRIGGENAGLLIVTRLEDPDPGVRAAAARGVGVLGIDRSLRKLIELIEDEPDDDVVIEACRAVGQFGDPSAVNALEKRAVGSFFSRPPTEVRTAAYQGLAGMGTPRARQLLEEALEDKDPEVRTAVRTLLKSREPQG